MNQDQSTTRQTHKLAGNGRWIVGSSDNPTNANQAAYYYKDTGTALVEKQRFVNDEPTGSQRFANGIDIANGGDVLFISNPLSDKFAGNRGRAFKYTYNSGTDQYDYLEDIDPTASGGGMMGFSMGALNENVIALSSENATAVSVYEKNSGSWSLTNLTMPGAALESIGERNIVGCYQKYFAISDEGTGGGFVYIYERLGLNNWSLVHTVVSNSGGTTAFGEDLHCMGPLLIVGDPNEATGGSIQVFDFRTL